MIKRALLASVAVAGLILALPVQPAQAQYYKGKTISLLVGFSAGGGSSRHGLAHIPYWQKHIPGNPDIIIKNMPGAGGMKATNFYAETGRPDGLTLLWGGFSPLNQVLGAKGLRARYDKFVFIGGGAGHQAAVIRTDVGGGIKSVQDLKSASGVIIGGLRPSILLDIQSRMALDMLGVKYRYVPGFRGSAKVYAAMARNEVNFYTTGNAPFYTQFKPQLIDKGQAIALWHYPKRDAAGKIMHRNPVFGDLQSFPQAVKDITGKEPSGSVWEAMKVMDKLQSKTTQVMFALPGTPPEAIADLRKGFDAAIADPGLEEVYKKQFGGPLIYSTVAEGEAMLAALGKIDPAVANTLRRYATPEAGK